MKILVSLKRVRDPDNANKVGVTPGGDALVASALEWKINPFDEYALEAALRLTEDGKNPKQRLGEIVVVTFGPAEADSKLRILSRNTVRSSRTRCGSMPLGRRSLTP